MIHIFNGWCVGGEGNWLVRFVPHQYALGLTGYVLNLVAMLWCAVDLLRD